MRRDSNRRQRPGQSFENKVLIAGGVILLLIIGLIIGMSIYSDSMNKNAKQFSSEEIASLVPNNKEDNIITSEAESASSSIGKSVDESKNTTNNAVNNIVTNNTTKQSNTTNATTTNTASKSVSKSKKNAKNSTKQDNTTQSTTKETKEISFAKPVEGDVIREFAKDNLVYSETLQEWVTHLGIDIKANKTTVVKASADGTIRSIKNDPRYGLTIIIDHNDGYQTIYSNLLTTEFVVEGEKVKQGQSIGTVGNTAVFEISDESHLHFEILKDSEQLDPNIYIK